MMAVYGRIQREGEVVHLIAHRLTDLSPELASIADREVAFSLSHGRGDQAKTGGGPDARETLGRKAREIYIPDLPIDRIKVKTRDFQVILPRAANAVTAPLICVPSYAFSESP